MAFPYGRVVVVTGGGSGIGLACVRLFAQRGYSVWSLHRSAKEGEIREAGGAFHCLACDVRDEESVRLAVARILSKEQEIGTLIHCAGFGIAGAAEDTPEEAVRRLFDTNYFGVLRVVRHTLPVMRAQGFGLTILVSSVAGVIPIPFQSHYSCTKFALNAYAEALRMETRPYALKVSLLEPGDTRTDFTDARKQCTPPGSPYSDASRRAAARMAKDEASGHPPEKVAKAAYKIAQSKNPPVRRTVGLYYKSILFLERILPARVKHGILRSMYMKA